MRSFGVGLLVGVLAGGGGVFLALEKPWESEEEQVAEGPEFDAGPVASSGKKGKKRKRKRGRRKKNANGELVEYFDDPPVALTPADRVMTWRGPSVKLPPKSMDFESGANGRPLNQGEINQGISSAKGAIANCIADSRGNAELNATIMLKFLVNENGRVTKSRIRAPAYLQKNGLHGCAKRATKRMNFPATGAATVVSIPFDLS